MEWCQVTRHPQIFCRLTGCQRTPGKWGVTFYLLDRSGFLFSCEVNSDGYKLRQIPSHSLKNPSLVESPWESYLVESPQGDLLQVINKYMHEFLVYKLVWHDSKDAIWEEVANLGDIALFLGESHSIYVKAPDFVGCQSNSIYYSRHSTHSLTKPVRVQHLPVKPPIRPRFGSYFEGSAFIFIVTSLSLCCIPLIHCYESMQANIYMISI